MLTLLVLLWPKSATAAERPEESQALGAMAVAVPDVQHFEQNGIGVDFSLTPADPGETGLRAGIDAVARLRLTDSRSQTPLGGSRPRAWITARRTAHPAEEATCADQIRSHLSGSLTGRADINLNSYLMLTLNSDRTITMINPQIAFSATKLETVIQLPANGADWVLSKNRRFLYVSLPEAGRLAVIDTISRRLVGTLSTGDGSAPTRLALQPDGRSVWVGLDGAAQVAVVDTGTNTLVRRLDSGAGLHSLAFSADSRHAYVSNSANDTVSIFEIASLSRIADLQVAATPVALAYGKASRAIYVAALNADVVTMIDTDRQEVAGSVPVRRGNVAIGFEPLGRYALALNQLDSTVTIIDSATSKITTMVKVVKEPDQLVFTRHYAYIRGLQSEKFTLISLSELRERMPAPLDIQAGTLPPGALPGEIGPASMIAPTPEGDSVLIANAPDSTIYHYSEGMMAPSGSFSNYKRLARGLLVLDRSLEEIAPGEFSAPVHLTIGGQFDVPILIDQPRVVHCFHVDVVDRMERDKASVGAALRVELLFPVGAVAAGKPTTFAFKVIDADSGEPVGGIRDLEALVFLPPGVWQQRPRVTEIGGGMFQFHLTLPRAGRYNVLFAAASRSIRLNDLPHGTLTARDGGDALPNARRMK